MRTMLGPRSKKLHQTSKKPEVQNLGCVSFKQFLYRKHLLELQVIIKMGFLSSGNFFEVKNSKSKFAFSTGNQTRKIQCSCDRRKKSEQNSSQSIESYLEVLKHSTIIDQRT